MAKKRTSRPTPSANPSFRGFLNIPLSNEDKLIIKSASYDSSDYSSDLEKWIDNGFKFTFGYDDYNHCFHVVAQRSDKEHEDYGIMLTGRGSTPVKALKQWVYIQTRLIGDLTWTEMLKPSPAFDIDD